MHKMDCSMYQKHLISTKLYLEKQCLQIQTNCGCH
nr:MAG TPA: hypothetical protein [Caudoviricetes sp.]